MTWYFKLIVGVYLFVVLFNFVSLILLRLFVWVFAVFVCFWIQVGLLLGLFVLPFRVFCFDYVFGFDCLWFCCIEFEIDGWCLSCFDLCYLLKLGLF